MRKRVVFMLIVAIVSALSYHLGTRFGYWEQHDEYWIIVAASLFSIGLAANYEKYSSSVVRGCLFGFGMGWLLSISTLVALQMATESEGSYGLIDALGQFQWYELLFYELSISLARFGWLPFLVMFGLAPLFEERNGAMPPQE